MRDVFRFSLLIIFLFTNILSAGAGDFQTARPGRVWQFPRDHGAHPEFKTEWWYYSGHLRSKEGEAFGYQLTFFRVALKQPDPKAKSAWTAHTVYFAHLALSAPGRGVFIFREKAARGAMGLAGAETGRLQVWVDDWQAKGEGGNQRLRAKTDDLSLDLTLTPLKPPVLHGENGYSCKAAGTDTASHYYSIPRLATEGRIKLGKQTLEVTGASWLDREFSTSHLTPDQAGWDWFALQLSDGADIMLYLMRLKNGKIDPASSGTLIDPQGQARHLTLADFQVKSTGAWKSPHSGATYPSGWQITIPTAGYHLTLTPTLTDQELRTRGSAQITYWEGQVHMQGQKNNQPLTGQGYTELTGYAGALGGRF
ncbi:MAG: lipocalin-like domain-containing protein [Thermodesulfobacteriota bacterium]